jgi:hypothetical protein
VVPLMWFYRLSFFLFRGSAGRACFSPLQAEGPATNDSELRPSSLDLPAENSRGFTIVLFGSSPESSLALVPFGFRARRVFLTRFEG